MRVSCVCGAMCVRIYVVMCVRNARAHAFNVCNVCDYCLHACVYVCVQCMIYVYCVCACHVCMRACMHVCMHVCVYGVM